MQCNQLAPSAVRRTWVVRRNLAWSPFDDKAHDVPLLEQCATDVNQTIASYSEHRSGHPDTDLSYDDFIASLPHHLRPSRPGDSKSYQVKGVMQHWKELALDTDEPVVASDAMVQGGPMPLMTVLVADSGVKGVK
jgi:hypothetical protein